MTLAKKTQDAYAVVHETLVPLSSATDYKLRVQVAGGGVDVFLDNVFVFAVNDSGLAGEFSRGSVGLLSKRAGIEFKSLRITFPRTSTESPTRGPTTLNPTVRPNEDLLCLLGCK